MTGKREAFQEETKLGLPSRFLRLLRGLEEKFTVVYHFHGVIVSDFEPRCLAIFKEMLNMVEIGCGLEEYLSTNFCPVRVSQSPAFLVRFSRPTWLEH